MFDTIQQRSAALGFGLAAWSILPVAGGSIAIEAAGQALAAYYYDLPVLDVAEPLEPLVIDLLRPTAPVLDLASPELVVLLRKP